MSIVIWLLTFVLVLLSVFLVLVVLMQKSKSDGGVGAALGGGMTEATFGAETGNMLATLTRNCTIAFFVLSFGLYLAHIHKDSATQDKMTLPTIPAAAVPATPGAAPVEGAAPAEVTVPATTVVPDATVTPTEAAPTEGATTITLPMTAPVAEPAK
jgi:preprotein translocase subunit SecG